MFRPLAVAVTLAALAAAPSAAKDTEPYYRAELSQPLAGNHVIAGGVLWMCDGTACVAGKGTGRPVPLPATHAVPSHIHSTPPAII